jgi:hypothetical protein
MTDEEEFAARWQFKWQRDLPLPPNGTRGPRHRPPPHVAISQSRRHPKRHGRPVQVQRYVMAQAVREVTWNAANEPQKCPVKRGSCEQKSSPMRLNAA